MIGDWLAHDGWWWGWCDLCDCAFVRCPKCGNNCCNAGTGDLPNGERCGCEAAYDHQHKCDKDGTSPTKAMIEST